MIRPKQKKLWPGIPTDTRFSVSEIKDFSDAHTGCTIPKTMHPANYVCILPYMIYLMLKKEMHFWVHGFKKPCTRQQNHAPRVQGAPLISDTDFSPDHIRLIFVFDFSEPFHLKNYSLRDRNYLFYFGLTKQCSKLRFECVHPEFKSSAHKIPYNK